MTEIATGQMFWVSACIAFLTDGGTGRGGETRSSTQKAREKRVFLGLEICCFRSQYLVP